MESFRATKLSKILEKIEKLCNEAMAKDLELQTMPGLVEEATILGSQATKFREAVPKNETSIAAMNDLKKEMSAVKKAGAKLPCLREVSRSTCWC